MLFITFMLETGAKDDFAKLVEGRVGAAGVSKPVMKKSSSSCPEKMKSLKYVKNYKQPSITQRFFNRKSVPWQHKQKNGRLSKKQVQKLQKEDLNLRKAELQQKALERKLKLEGDNFLKITRDQMMTNVCAIIFKHIEAA